MNRQRRSRRLHNLILFFVLLIIVSYGAVSYMGFRILTSPPGRLPRLTPRIAHQEVTFPARGRSYPVYAYLFSSPASSRALIVVHGIGSSRHGEGEQEVAQAIHALGYTILLIDLSDAAGDTVGNGHVALGADERWDVLGAYDYLLTQGFAPEKVGLMGWSMGAATILLAAGIEPRIKAIWEDSGYDRVLTVLEERLQTTNVTPLILPGGLLWNALITGTRLWEIAPIDGVPGFARNRQAIYIVHGELDTVVRYSHGERLYAASKQAGVDVTFWSLPNTAHTEGFNRFRDEYLRRLDEFFRAHLN
jgi:uncharacterized protein